MSGTIQQSITSQELEFIQAAARYLESPSLMVRLTALLGKPIEKGLEALPSHAQETISKVTRTALEKALSLSIKTVSSGTHSSIEAGIKTSYWTDWKHTLLSSATGAAGGFFGLASLPIELPITTCVMLRAIASIADDFGHDLKSSKIQLECLSVFSLGSPSTVDDEMDSAYFSTRIGLSKLIDNAARWLSKKTSQEVAQALAEKSAPALIQFLARLSSRFEVMITEKAIAEALPGIGAVTGAAINACFSDHFNTVARYHFGIRALEIRYGDKPVRDAYDAAKRS